jgi:hypothetical protein
VTNPNHLARTAGVLYLIVAVLGGFAHLFVRAAVYVPGDATETAQKVVANADLVRLGFVADLTQATVLLFVALTLSRLLGHVDRGAARTMVILVAISVAIMCLNLVHHLAALIVATSDTYAQAFGPGGSDGIVLLLLDLHHYGFLIAQMFFGLWLIPLGYLVYRSHMLPRTLGVLLVIGGIGSLIDMFAMFLIPDVAATLSPFLVIPAALAELSLIGWLLIKGVRESEPIRDVHTTSMSR